METITLQCLLIWNKIINYFKLTNFEKEAAKKFSSYYKGEDYPDHHVFICSECAEKALGREITDKDINDLISHLERSTLISVWVNGLAISLQN